MRTRSRTVASADRGYRTKEAKGQDLERSSRSREPGEFQWKLILVPYDFSEPARKAFRFAERMAASMGAKLSLVHVVAPLAMSSVETGWASEQETDFLKSARERLDAVAGICRPPELVESVLVRMGSPFVEISRAARDVGADLLVVGTHGFSSLKHAFAGSTMERVIRHAPCPVLVVRGGEE